MLHAFSVHYYKFIIVLIVQYLVEANGTEFKLNQYPLVLYSESSVKIEKNKHLNI